MQLYNHLKRKPYTINFERWLFAFNDHSAFFDDWSRKLYIAYMSSINKPTETDGCFQSPYISNNELFYIHFNLGNILKNAISVRILLLMFLYSTLLYHQTSLIIFTILKNSGVLKSIFAHSSQYSVVMCLINMVATVRQ